MFGSSSRKDLNFRPPSYQDGALPRPSYATLTLLTSTCFMVVGRGFRVPPGTMSIYRSTHGSAHLCMSIAIEFSTIRELVARPLPRSDHLLRVSGRGVTPVRPASNTIHTSGVDHQISYPHWSGRDTRIPACLACRMQF